jgi:hypothetical protein
VVNALTPLQLRMQPALSAAAIEPTSPT